MTEPNAARRSRPRRAWIILGIVGFVVVLCCAGGVLGVGQITGLLDGGDKAPATSAAQHYLDDLVKGDYNAAYGRLCQADQAQRSLDEFSQQPSIASYRITGTAITYPAEGPAIATVDVTLSETQKHRGVRQLTLIDDDGTWLVCQTSGAQPAS